MCGHVILPRKIFGDWEDWAEHVCAGCGRVRVYVELVDTYLGSKKRLLLQGRGHPWVLSRAPAGWPARGLGHR